MHVRKRDIRCHDKCEIMYHHKAGNSVSCESYKYFNGTKLTQICAEGIFKFYQN